MNKKNLYHIRLTHRWDHKSTITLGQSGPWSNGNEGVLNTSQISKIETSLSDLV